MFAGLDFGTSNSAFGVAVNHRIELLPLFENHKYLPSTLYSFDRHFLAEFIYRNICSTEKESFKQARLNQLQRAANIRRHEGFDDNETCIYFGEQAIEHYIDHPEEGTFIKSPKSFLGSTGLSQTQIQFFEDLVTAMMLNIKNIAELQSKRTISNLVIGRPVNYQGVDSEKSNRQAIEIMQKAAKRCGYRAVEFLFEPIAAGVDFETGLNENKIVLVVDIGGGTTDCSIVKMGPSFVKKDDRSQDFLAHTGERIGGNDLDILLSHQCLMPLFGRFTQQKKGTEVPHGPFWSAVAINNAGEQAIFSGQEYLIRLNALRRNVKQPELIDRLIYLQQSKQNHRLVRSAELAKIHLSEQSQIKIDLNYIENDLSQLVTQNNFDDAVRKPLIRIQKLISEAIKRAQTQPDIIYITGGSAKSTILRNTVNQILPDTPILDGDYYGSVATGLTKWATKIWA